MRAASPIYDQRTHVAGWEKARRGGVASQRRPAAEHDRDLRGDHARFNDGAAGMPFAERSRGAAVR